MRNNRNYKPTHRKFGYSGLLLAALILTAVTLANSQEEKKVETIDATAMGTSTQLGQNVGVKIIITRYSTDEDRAILVDAFKKGQSKGLVDALEKMPSVGRIAITGTIGSDLAYVRLVRTDTGRKIRFATNRRIRFAEAYNNGPSKAYDLTAGEFDLNDSDAKRSSGVLFPAAQLIINKEGQLEFQLRKNQWKLVNVIDWNGAGTPK